MDKIKLTQQKLIEILNEADNDERMEYYYNAAINDMFEANQHMALVGLLFMLVRHYHTKLFVKTPVDPSTFFGLNTLNEQSDYWKFYELLKRTNFEIALCLIGNENIPEKPLIEFSEIQSYTLFCFGDYLKSLSICQNALTRDDNNSLCNFLKASIIELCHINKTSIPYKIALLNYQKGLIDKCNPTEIGFDIKIYENVISEINSKLNSLGEVEKQISFTHIKKNFEETKETVSGWTEEHDFYLRNNLFLNPLSNFEKFVECSIEELEDLPIEQEYKELFSEIIEDYKLCRGITYSYYKGINNVGKREMSMTYSYTYSIFDKLAYLIKQVYKLKISDDNTGFTKNNLFDVKIQDSNITFGKIKNINIVPLYFIMKDVRTKQNITNAIQIGTFEHNELRNTIDHKSILKVEDGKLKRNSSMLLELARNAILYTFMLLHSCSNEIPYDVNTTLSTTFFKAILNKKPEQK